MKSLDGYLNQPVLVLEADIAVEQGYVSSYDFVYDRLANGKPF